jgi:hypothetical protein
MYTLYKSTAGNQFSYIVIVYTYSTAKLLSHMETASPPRLDLGEDSSQPVLQCGGRGS